MDEWIWSKDRAVIRRGKPEELGEKDVSLPLCPPQILPWTVPRVTVQ
jgi:hypothetical protein